MTALLDEHPHLGVELVLRETGTPPSTYYRRRRRERQPTRREQEDAVLTEKIKEVHATSHGTYGSPRVHAALAREGTRVGRKRVERLMRRAGITGISPRTRRWKSTVPGPAADFAPDLVHRDFTSASAGSARSSTRRSTTPNRHRLNERT